MLFHQNGRARRTAGLLICLLCAWAGTVSAADDALTWQIRPELDPLPPELDGLLVTLYQTASPQIAVHNLTGKPLVILDRGNQPFLRIGPYEIYANFANPVFHRSRYIEEIEPPDNASGPDRWRKVSNGPAWAWFDPRLRTAGLKVPDGPLLENPALIKRWAIPVRLGDTKGIISGYFLYHEAPNGFYRTRLSDEGNLAPGVSVYPTAGMIPGLFISSRGNAEFTVLGMDGEPFLRFVPGKVMINRSSPTWRVAAPPDTLVPYVASASDKATWVVISTTGSFGWLEPRAFFKGSAPDSANPVQVKQWQVPVVFADGRKTIEGTTQWLPGVNVIN
ncbi:MAG: hypothetical protein L0H83_03000 [Salinisphaera sp.]|nr:hypothetical protein [Salinisphaera sp.]